MRISNHKLNIEIGRHETKNSPFIDANKRYCIFCKDGSIEDEYHFIFECKSYKILRSKFFPELCNPSNDAFHLSQEDKLQFLFNSKDSQTLTRLAQYVTEIFEMREINIVMENILLNITGNIK